MTSPSLCVLYGQTAHHSTSIQTRHLAQALSSFFEIQPLELLQRAGRQISKGGRFLQNLIRPLVHRTGADFLLYGNDGFADVSMWGKCRTIVYWYDTPWDYSRKPPKMWQAADWLRYRNVIKADLVFAVSHTQVELAKLLRPSRENSVHYLPVGADCHLFDPSRYNRIAVMQKLGLPPKQTVIGYLGYIGIIGGRYAGQPIVEMAAALLTQTKAHFLIVGFGPGLRPFQEHVAAIGASKHFTFTGQVAHERVPEYLAAMDICIDTLEEGFHSLARSETKLKAYMAMGRACVATAIGENCVDLDNGAAGVLVQPGKDDLLRGVRELCIDTERRERLGHLARRRAEEIYDWPRLALRFATAARQV